MAVDPNVFIATGTTVTLVSTAALWKLASMLAEIRTTVKQELTPNGGGSLRDKVHETSHDLRNVRLLLELHVRDPNAHVSPTPMKEVV